MLARLLNLLFPLRDDEETLVGVKDDEFLALIAPESVSREGLVVTALLPFADGRVRAAVHEAKYRGQPRAFKLLAAILGEYLRELASDGELRRAILIPVPLGALRRKTRGYNQIEEVLTLVSNELDLPLETSALTRTRETPSQISLPRWRRKQNMRGAFGAAHSVDPSLLYILVDDVTTTGATLSAAVLALRSAGAEHILPIALAH